MQTISVVGNIVFVHTQKAFYQYYLPKLRNQFKIGGRTYNLSCVILGDAKHQTRALLATPDNKRCTGVTLHDIEPLTNANKFVIRKLIEEVGVQLNLVGGRCNEITQSNATV